MGAKMITLTEAAKNKVTSILSEQSPDSKLRMFVYGKGCAGLTYGFDVAHTVEADDTIFDNDGVAVVVDADSLPYLSGSVIDYVDSLTGSRFDINNPNAKSSCGCGDSFNPY